MSQILERLVGTLWIPNAEKLTQINSTIKLTSLRQTETTIKKTEEVKPVVQQVALPTKDNSALVIKPENIVVESKPPQKQEIKEISFTNLEKMYQQIKVCHNCELGEMRKNSVIYRGNNKSKVMFIVDAPSIAEQEQALFSVGEEWELLQKMIIAMKLDPQQDVYITGLLKCHAPHKAKDEELNACRQYLENQIKLIQPRVIITLGALTGQKVLMRNEALVKLRGAIHQFMGIPVVATYDPSYLLFNTESKRQAWEDLQLAMSVY